MKKILLVSLCTLIMFSGTSCSGIEISKKIEFNTEIGEIGETTGVTKGQATKMLALLFYTEKELETLEYNKEFSDIDEKSWCFPYVKGVIAKGVFTNENSKKFKLNDFLTLSEAWEAINHLSPDLSTQINITSENENRAISYNLWIDMLEKAFSPNGNGGFASHGITEKTNIILKTNENEVAFFDEILQQTGYDLSKYTHQEITVLVKGEEIFALLEVVDLQPIFKGVYYTIENNKLKIASDMEIVFPYEGENEMGFGDIIVIDNKVVSIEPLESLDGDTIRRFDKATSTLYLENNGSIKVSDRLKVCNENNSLRDSYEFIAGSNTTEFYLSEGEIVGAKVHELPMPNDIKVLLGGGSHDQVTISSSNGFNLSNSSASREFKNENAVLSPDLSWFNNGEVVKVEGDKVSIIFGNSSPKSYTGDIEIEVIDNKLVVVETSNMEDYLKGVVPHEMPSSFGQSALEAQAICARSYAYNEFFINAYGSYGANITDTTASQVYSGAETNAEATLAVDNTAGMCLISEDGKVAITYFYSTSSGFGAKDVEVWSYDGTFSGDGKSYLQGKAHGVEETMPTSEEEWLELWQDWEVAGYDENSPFYRWKAYFTKAQIEEILTKKLVEVSKEAGNKITVKTGEGEFVSETPENLGAYKSIKVAQRGESGVVEIIEIAFSNKTVRVATENTIRKVLVPQKMTVGDEIYLQRIDGANVATQTMLPSGFFAINETDNGVAVYGGGFGHGVGLSQYGAKELSQRGYSAEEILKEYYADVEVAKVLG